MRTHSPRPLLCRKIELLVVPLFVLAACSRKPEPNTEPNAASKTAASADNRPATPAPPTPGSAAGREIVWTDPPGWQKVPSNSAMRKATYKIPAVSGDGEDGEMAVFYFRGEGGETEANIQRWIGQFPDAKPEDAKRSQRTVSGLKQTIVELEGTYSSGMPGSPTPATPKPQYRLIGAVVETPAGPHFFKLTGPKKTVEAARGAFFSMLDSVRSS
jgi:hypothetical protein